MTESEDRIKCWSCGEEMVGSVLGLIGSIDGEEVYICNNFCCIVDYVEEKEGEEVD